MSIRARKRVNTVVSKAGAYDTTCDKSNGDNYDYHNENKN